MPRRFAETSPAPTSPAPASLGILTGAGISAAPPASLPLGDEFHELLLSGCRAAARAVAGDAVTGAGPLRVSGGGRRNILGCIEDSLDRGTIADVLGCLRVEVPTEAHLLCALHAARGARQATVNFDDGIEVAYRLLRGDAELPARVPAGYRAALAAWRAAMPAAGPLRVASTPEELRRRDGDWPLLVKLRGCAARGTDGTVVPVRPAVEDLESTRLDDDRHAALRAVSAAGHLLVTGHSGRDLDCFESLRGLLRSSGFSWVAPELTTPVVERIRAIDPSQPIRGTAEAALRAHLPASLRPPPWPRIACGGDGFRRRFAQWWQRVPPAAAAEAYAWLLADAGRHREAVTILRALLGADDRVRVRLRLAGALARRGRDDDLREAVRLFDAVAGDTSAPAPVRAYAQTRWAECRVDMSGATIGRTVHSAAACTAALVRARDRRVAVRALVGLGHVARRRVGERIPATPAAAWLSAMVAGAGVAALRAGRWQARRAGTACRQTDLELALLDLELRRCRLTGHHPPGDAPRRLAAVERAYAHRGDAAGRDSVQRVRTLAATLAYRRRGHRGEDRARE